MHRAVKIIAPIVVVALVVIGVAATASGKNGAPAQTAAVSPDAYTATAVANEIAPQISSGRAATAKYAMNLAKAKADGYGIITRMIPDMGYHFLNPNIKGFDVRKPQILVYEHHGKTWQLGALEWVFTSMPAKPPIAGAQYGVFGAACHYADGTFVFQNDQTKCATKSPQTGAKFNFWHPKLITLHMWIWYPNPSGIYMGYNPLVQPFNRG